MVASCQLGSVTLRLPGGASYDITASTQLRTTSVTVPQSAHSGHMITATSQLGSVTVTG